MEDDRSVAVWQAHFAHLYDIRNRKRFGPDPYVGLSRLWLNLVEETNQLSKAIRHNDLVLVTRFVPHMFCWLCATCNKAEISLEDAAWEFFPFVCPTCWHLPCICGTVKTNKWAAPQKDARMLSEYAMRNGERRPRTLNSYVVMFAEIYKDHPDSASMLSAYLHFNEEVAEVAQCVRALENTQNHSREVSANLLRALRSELADVFSWVCKLCWLADNELQVFNIGATSRPEGSGTRPERLLFSSIVAREYLEGCPTCGGLPCREDRDE